MPPEQLKPKKICIYHISWKANRLQPTFCPMRVPELKGRGFSWPCQAGTPPASDGEAALAACRCPSLLRWRDSGLFLLDFDEQESWSDLRDLDTYGQIDLILREQKVVDPLSYLCETYTRAHRTRPHSFQGKLRAA